MAEGSGSKSLVPSETNDTDTIEPTPTTATIQLSQYEIDRERNIADLKNIVNQLKKDFPMGPDVEGKKKKERVPQKQQVEGETTSESSGERRQSERLKPM